MNDSSTHLYSKSWQQPSNLAMMLSVVAHGVLFAGLALVPASSQQTIKKQLRVVSLLQSPPEQPNSSNQPIDPNAPPPAPGVAGLPLNITTPDGLEELPVTDTPNPAFDPFASSVVGLPPLPPQSSLPPFDPGPLPPDPSPPPIPANPAPSPDADGEALSQDDFEAWLRGNADLPGLSPDPGASSGPLTPPEVAPGPVASKGVPPEPTNSGRPNPDTIDTNSLAAPSIAPPADTIERLVAYNYPQAACENQLEGKAEYRIWVSSQATPVVSDIVLSTESPVLDQAVKVAAQKYKIKAEDANKLVVLPFDFKYSAKACALKEPPTPKPSNQPNPSPTRPKPAAPSSKPADAKNKPETNTPVRPSKPIPSVQPKVQPKVPRPARPVKPTPSARPKTPAPAQPTNKTPSSRPKAPVDPRPSAPTPPSQSVPPVPAQPASPVPRPPVPVSPATPTPRPPRVPAQSVTPPAVKLSPTGKSVPLQPPAAQPAPPRSPVPTRPAPAAKPATKPAPRTKVSPAASPAPRPATAPAVPNSPKN